MSGRVGRRRRTSLRVRVAPFLLLPGAIGLIAACNAIVGVEDLPYPRDAGVTAEDAGPADGSLSDARGDADAGPAVVHDAGAMADIVCSSGAKRCVTLNNETETCGADGQWGAATACPGGYCNGFGICGVCATADTQCVDGGLRTCGASGQWSAPQPCAQATPDCVGNTCECPGVQCNGTCVAQASDCACPSQPGDAGACAAPIVDGAVPLNICALTTVVPGSGMYTFGDGVTTVCVDSTAMCAQGVTAANIEQPDGAFPFYGGGFGFGFASPVKPSGSGLVYGVSEVPPNGLTFELYDPANIQYSYILAPGGAQQGTIPWSSFTISAYQNLDGGPFSTSDTITQINFQASAGAVSANWNFCVTALGL